jgi:hypothetical protein
MLFAALIGGHLLGERDRLARIAGCHVDRVRRDGACNGLTTLERGSDRRAPHAAVFSTPIMPPSPDGLSTITACPT